MSTEAQVRALIDGPTKRQRWIAITSVDELRGVGPLTMIRIKGRVTTAETFGPFLHKMVRDGVKVEIPW